MSATANRKSNCFSLSRVCFYGTFIRLITPASLQLYIYRHSLLSRKRQKKKKICDKNAFGAILGTFAGFVKIRAVEVVALFTV